MSPVIDGRPQTYEEIIDGLVVALRKAGAALPHPAPTPWDSFLRLSDLVHSTFHVPSTTFTAMMRRLVFALGFAAAPRHIVGVGTYVGYTFSWLLRDRSDPHAGPYCEAACGIDPDNEANATARRNCTVLDHGARLAFRDAQGAAAVAELTTPIDLLYLDLDDPVTGKAGYRDVLETAVPRLNPGALVLAHDPCVPRFERDFVAYHEWIRVSGRFAGPLVLPVDSCGLSVASARGLSC